MRKIRMVEDDDTDHSLGFKKVTQQTAFEKCVRF